MKYIDLNIEDKKRLEKMFETTRMGIWRALCFKSNSEQSKRIRAVALEMGGRVIHELDVTDGFVPNCQTIINVDDDDRVTGMTLRYPHDVRIESYDGSATLYVGDKAERRYWNVTLGSLYKVALEAQLLSESLAS